MQGSPPWLIFIGDSRMRQIRDWIYLVLTGVERDAYTNHGIQENQFYDPWTHHTDIVGTSNATLEFIFISYVNKELVNEALKNLTSRNLKRRPDVVVVSFGLRIVKECHEKNVNRSVCMDYYKE